MTTLSVAALAALISANNCVRPELAPIMIGIARSESGLQEYAIHDNSAGISFSPDTAKDAIALAAALIRRGHSLDLGIGQINERNLAWTGLTIETAFDPCRNMAAAAKVLFARYNGNPPDAQKAKYAQGVISSIPTQIAPSTPQAGADLVDEPILSPEQTYGAN